MQRRSNINCTQTMLIYLGIIEGEHVIFKQQVDDFAVAAPDEHTANILL
jgi:hypothetical protein